MPPSADPGAAPSSTIRPAAGSGWRASPGIAGLAIAALLALGLARTVAVYFVRDTTLMVDKWDPFPRYLDGSVDKPFAYRVLTPALVRAAMALIPARVSAGVAPHLVRGAPGPATPEQRVGIAAMSLLAFFAYAALMGLAFRALPGATAWQAALVPSLSLVALVPFLSRGPAHVYDPTVLLFGALFLVALLQRRHALFALTFCLSCLNKETTLLWAFAYLAFFAREQGLRAVLTRLLPLGLFFAATFLFLRWRYAGNGGEPMQHRLWQQIEWLTNLSFADLAAFAVWGGLLLRGFFRQAPGLRWAAIAIALNLVAFLFGAAGGELRNLYETLPLLLLYLFSGLFSAIGAARGDADPAREPTPA